MDKKNQMDRVVAFVRDFARADLEVEVARNSMDFAAYSRGVQALRPFLADTVSPGLGFAFPSDVDEDTRKLLEAQARELRSRVLFKVKRWEHPREGRLYQAYLGSPIPDVGGYSEARLIKPVHGGFKIIGRYSVCLACFATGHHGGKRCPDCYAPGWNYREGLRLKTFGKLIETRRLEPPTNPSYLPEYESD